jgi:hypothetical protein
MKKSVWILLLMLMAAPLWCQVTGSIESENHLQSGDFSTQMQFWLQGNFNKQIGYWGWALVFQNWGEIYSGVSWKAASWLQVGIGAGIEHGQSKARLAEFLWMGKGKFYLFALTEHGGSGFWYRAFAMYVVDKRFQVGLMSQYKLGIGPKVEIALFKPFSVWLTAMTFGENPKTSFFGTLKIGF